MPYAEPFSRTYFLSYNTSIQPIPVTIRWLALGFGYEDFLLRGWMHQSTRIHLWKRTLIELSKAKGVTKHTTTCVEVIANLILGQVLAQLYHFDCWTAR